MIIKESVLKRIIRNILLEGGGYSSIYATDEDRKELPQKGQFGNFFNSIKKKPGSVSIQGEDVENDNNVAIVNKSTIKKKKSILIQNVTKVLESCVDKNPELFTEHDTMFFVSFIKMLSEKEFLHLTQENDIVDVQNFIYDFYKSVKKEGPTNEKTYQNAIEQKYENSALEILLTNWSQFSKFISNTQELNNQILNKVVTTIVKIKQKYRTKTKQKISFDASTNDIDYLTAKEAKAKNPSHKVSGY